LEPNGCAGAGLEPNSCGAVPPTGGKDGVGAGGGTAGLLPKANGALEDVGAVVVGRGVAPNANAGGWVAVVGISSLQRFLEGRCCCCELVFPRWSLDGCFGIRELGAVVLVALPAPKLNEGVDDGGPPIVCKLLVVVEGRVVLVPKEKFRFGASASVFTAVLLLLDPNLNESALSPCPLFVILLAGS